jgi:hypothetical protein
MHTFRTKCFWACLLTAGCIAGVSGKVDAVEMSWQPTLQLGGGYDTNVRMAYEDLGQEVEESALYQAQAGGKLAVDSEDAKIELSGRYWYQTVTANDDYDASVKQVRWNYTGSNERSALTLDLNVQHDTTLTSEFESSGLSLRDKKDRHVFQGEIGYRWQLTERDQLSANFSDEQIRYIDADNTGLSDYDTQSTVVGFSRGLSERASIGTQLEYSVFDIPEVARITTSAPLQSRMSYETENTILVAFGSYSFNEQDSLTFQAGFRTSRFYSEQIVYIASTGDQIDSSRSKDKGNGSVFSVGYRHQFDASSLQISLARNLMPNGSGIVIEQDSVSADLKHSFSPRFSLNTTLSANRQQRAGADNEPGTDSISEDGRDFAQLVMSLQFAMTEDQDLSLELNERWQQFDTSETIEAEGTAVFLRWYWNPASKLF